jgi:PAS domain S-box-containing protein
MATILIVDDRSANREFLITLLSYGGHRLIEAADGAEGLAVTRSEHPDLIIADILMPTMDGYEFVRQIRMDPALANSRVIFYTAQYHEPEARNLASACGVSAVLTKPCEPEVILQTVEAALGQGFPITEPEKSEEKFDREHLRLVTDKLSQKAEELGRTNDRLTAIVELGIQLGSERDPGRLLQAFCDATREIVGARYAIVGIPSGGTSDYRYFLASGMDVPMMARVGRPKLGGVLASIVGAGRCFRAANQGGPHAAGLPSTFPPVEAILAAPVVSPARIYGWVCLLDKVGGQDFSDEDERLAKMLAAQVGRIYENGSLYADLLGHATKLAEEVAERKRGEAALRENEERFRGAFENTGVAMALTDIENRLIRVNAAMAQLFGYTEHELLTKSMADLTYPADLATSLAGREKLLDGSAPFFQVEKRYVHRDGHIFWGLTNVSLVRDQSGRPQLYVGQIQDITDRKRAEAEARRSSELLQAVADETSDAVYVKDRSGVYLLSNKAAARFMGRPVDYVLGKNDSQLFEPESAQRIKDRDQRVMDTGDVINEEETLTAAGVTRTYLVAKAPYRDGQGNITGLIGISRDISARKRTERLQLAQYAATKILANSPSLQDASIQILEALCRDLDWEVGELWQPEDGAQVLRHVVAWHAPEQKFSDFDAATRRMSFAPGSGLPGRIWSGGKPCWIPDVASDPNFLRRESALQAGLRSIVGFPIMLGGEVLGVLAFLGQQIQTPDSELLGVMAAIGSQIGQFIERKRAEEELRQSEERFRQIAENIREVFWLHDPINHKILYVSHAYESIWGRPAQALYSSAGDWLQPIHPDDADRVRQSSIIRTGADHYDEEYRIIRPDGAIRWIHDQGFPVLDENGVIFRIAGVAEDITERVRANETRQKLEAQLLQSQKMEAFGQLAGGIAHDFNNLLTIINGYSEILFSSLPVADSKRAAVKAISEAGTRAAALTQQLLAFSRQTVLEPKVLDINQVIRETEKMLRRLIGEDILLSTRLERSVRHVKVDPSLIGQVLMNLAVNSRDAMPRGGELCISTENQHVQATGATEPAHGRPRDYVCIAVRDTGEGMAAEVKARIFEPFFTTKGVGKGTGLGLAVVHGVVNQSGGHIEVESEPGKGTAFKLYFPAVDAGLSKRESDPLEQSLTGAETILLVEDEENVRGLFSLALQARGYRVLAASNGIDAIKVAENHGQPIHLLLTDVVMPRMSGRELADALTSRFPGLRVLYMSGYTDDAVVRHGLVQEKVPFLQKPATPARLASKVRTVLDEGS